MRRLSAVLLSAAAGIVPAAGALAHGGVDAAAAGNWSAGWPAEPAVALPLLLLILWYGLGLRSLRAAGRLATIAPPHRVGLFGAAVFALALTLLSPLASLSELLFSAHMTEHLLLMLVAAPLLAAAQPMPVLLWALPPPSRRRVLFLWRRSGIGQAVGALCRPVPVWVLFSGAFVFWHVPGPFRWALENDWLHVLEHLCYLVTAMMFWGTVLGTLRRPRLGHGATLIFIGTTALLSDLPGALLLLAPTPIYPGHPEVAAQFGLTLLQDQQLAGVVMWVPMGFAFVAAGAFVFMRWIGAAERLAPAYRVAGLVLALLAVPGLLGGCDDDKAKAAQQQDRQERGHGDAKRGARLVAQYGCGGCHSIPGIEQAHGRVGPPLDGFGERLYVAGMLVNTPDNLVAWIENPQRIVPGNVMPNLGIRERDAQDIASFLYTLR